MSIHPQCDVTRLISIKIQYLFVSWNPFARNKQKSTWYTSEKSHPKKAPANRAKDEKPEQKALLVFNAIHHLPCAVCCLLCHIECFLNSEKKARPFVTDTLNDVFLFGSLPMAKLFMCTVEKYPFSGSQSGWNESQPNQQPGR